MIIDNLTNADCYYDLGERLKVGLKFLEENNFTEMADGKYEIDGDNIFAIVDSYETMPPKKKVWEGHRKYIDIQYLVKGTELMGYSNLDNMKLEQYDEDKDFLAFAGKGDFVTVKSNHFIIFMPQDVHMPGVSSEDSQEVKKVVVKVKAE